MAIAPGTYNISLQRRADYSVTLQFKDSTGTAINLTGWTAAAQAWNQDRTTKYADFTVTYTNRLGLAGLTVTFSSVCRPLATTEMPAWALICRFWPKGPGNSNEKWGRGCQAGRLRCNGSDRRLQGKGLIDRM